MELSISPLTINNPFDQKMINNSSELKNSFTRFIAIYKMNFKVGKQKAYMDFNKFFNRHYEKAIEYLANLKTPEQLKEASKDIHELSGHLYNNWTNISDIEDFKIIVPWDDNSLNDYHLLFYHSLPSLIKKISEELSQLDITSQNRKVFALLLQTLLPCYFVKVANITPVVNLLQKKLDHFICVGYPPKDYPALKKAPEADMNSWQFDSCRGIFADSDDSSTFYFLFLGFNPNAESLIPKKVAKEWRNNRSKFIEKFLHHNEELVE